VVGRYSVLLCEYDEHLKPSEINFDSMDIWVRLLDLPLGWMNQHRGARVMGLIGAVKKVDVDKDGKASGPYLRARVGIEIAKPLRRGVLMKTKKDGSPEWFDLQYEKLPFFSLSCGVMGHSHFECDKPVVRNAEGKLPYDVTKLRAADPKKKNCRVFQRQLQRLLEAHHHLNRSRHAVQRANLMIDALLGVGGVKNLQMVRRRRSPHH
jgi:hypothetical protein